MFEKAPSWMFDRVLNTALSILERALYPAGIYLLKVNYRKTTRRCKIGSKSTIKTC